MSSTFRLRLTIPRRVCVQGRALEREAAFAWIWAHLKEFGLLGIQEGEVSAERASSAGLETESFSPFGMGGIGTVDAGLAPRERDWVGALDQNEADLYFSSAPGARKAAAVLRDAGFEPGAIEEQKPEDWDARWKAAFLQNGNGVQVAPFWKIIPPWVETPSGQEITLKINPGAGFGTGTHETTQLCLKALGEAVGPSRDLKGARVLDFGSGSGILSIAAARLGGRVIGVEIDPLAVANARENAALNGVEDRCAFLESLADVVPDVGADAPSFSLGFSIVMANILRPVLLQFAPELVSRVGQGTLILSGLVEGDVPEIADRFGKLLARGHGPRIESRGEWRALVWPAG